MNPGRGRGKRRKRRDRAGTEDGTARRRGAKRRCGDLLNSISAATPLASAYESDTSHFSPLTSYASSPIPALPRVPSVSVLGVPGVHGGPTDVLMQNSLYLVNRGVAGKNRVARGYDQFGFGAIEMRAAVGNDSVGTFCSAAQSTITHDTMKPHPDWKCGYAIQDRVGRQRK
jgi:hypothetical protein